MFVDLTLNTPPMDELVGLVNANVPAALSRDQVQKLLESGHIGTHFDVMDKQWPFERFRTNGKLFDISRTRDREIEIADLAGQTIEEGDTVIFHTGMMKEFGFATKAYTSGSANLSDETVSYLIDKKIHVIAVDGAGAQKQHKHLAVDQRCADSGVFILENIDNMDALVAHAPKPFFVYIAPLNRRDLTGLPCRVVVELPE